MALLYCAIVNYHSSSENSSQAFINTYVLYIIFYEMPSEICILAGKLCLL